MQTAVVTHGPQGSAAVPSLSTCDKAVHAASDATPRTPPALRCDRRRSGKRAIDQLQAVAFETVVPISSAKLALRPLARALALRPD